MTESVLVDDRHEPPGREQLAYGQSIASFQDSFNERDLRFKSDSSSNLTLDEPSFER